MFKINFFYQTYLPKFVASDLQLLISNQKKSIDRLHMIMSYLPSLTTAFSSHIKQFELSMFLQHYCIKAYTPSQKNLKKALIEQGREMIMSSISKLQEFHQNLFQIFVLIWRQFHFYLQENSQQQQKAVQSLQKIKPIYDQAKLFAVMQQKLQEMNEYILHMFEVMLSRECHTSFIQFLNNFLQQCNFSQKMITNLKDQITKNQGNYQRKNTKLEDYDPNQIKKESKCSQQKKSITRKQLFDSALTKGQFKVNTETPIKEFKSCKILDTTQQKSFSELDQSNQNEKPLKKMLESKKWKVQERAPLQRTIHSKRTSKFVPKKVVHYEQEGPSLSASFSQVFYDNGKRVSQRSYKERQLSEDEVSILVQATPKGKKKIKLQINNSNPFDQKGHFICN